MDIVQARRCSERDLVANFTQPGRTFFGGAQLRL
jgi:hypothetical protein